MAETPAKVAQSVAIENAKANTPSGQLEQAEKRASLQEKALSVKKTMEEPVIGFNPQTGERELVSRDDARAGGFTQTVPVKEGDVEKYRTATSQFNDVQINVSRYRDAFANFAQHGEASDLPKLNVVINDAKLGGGIKLGSMGELQLPLGSSLAEAADRVARSTAYKDLSTAGKGLVDGYLRTMGAVPAYQKALTGIGRSNKEMLDLELKNIPDPTYAPADADRKLQSFQENIDQGSAGIPRIQGVPTPKDVRRQFEGGVRQTFRVPTFGQ